MTVTVGKNKTSNANILLYKPFNDTEEEIPPLPKSPYVATEITTRQEAKLTVIHTLMQLKQYLVLLIS